MSRKNLCPGCGNEKTARARLCASCRRRANNVGESAWKQSAGLQGAPARPRTPEQNRVYHGKLASIAKLEKAELFDVKQRTLEFASLTFEREIKSSTELTELEMEHVLEQLDIELHRLGYSTLATT